ncbi:MAG: SDR family oxidoreductase [Paracoccaceae bacterium]|mgnify:FL=1|jgi:NAD(P)-dependent dehydrogenase (short-subunit alcohol dehydrogenase family)|nr:SDR family oxidoreductase [Paracoccaceae bacterium]HAQ45856.1 3-oxoacyl-ACP reductase [Rhodobacter sp.]MDO7654581.1 SDR family oxidoreductase [Paracoccaceae bacterium]MDO7658505.1 SDR family oxidoreductase [Paracoccaceae bacterium]MDO7708560.1 SDR family oxidoreductase [Paracoccaceae bacterium]
MKTIIITGAGRGIGRATALAFLDAGWAVGLIGRDVPALEETAKGYEGALVLGCDVSEEQAVDRAFGAACDRWGHLDALFNNAGIMLKGALIDEIAVQDWRDLIDINLTGSFICARAAFRQMRKQLPQGGRIINNGSISAHAPRWGSVAYTASKHAITGLTKTLSLDGRPFDIACSQIDIGNALTDMARTMTTGMPQADGSIKAEAVMDVTHVAQAVLNMATLPLEVNVQFMTLMASKMPFVGRG